MKKLICLFALTSIGFAGFSQDDNAGKKFNFTVGIEGALPVGNYITGVKFSDVTSFGIGGYVQGIYNASENLGITLHTGYTSFSAKEFMGVKGDAVSVVPVLVGIKYGFTENFYGAAQIGASFLSGNGDSETALTYAPGIGYKFSNFDVSLNYTGRTYKVDVLGSKVSVDASSIGLRFGYTF